MGFNFSYPNGYPKDRGWGSGWPTSRAGEMQTLTVNGKSFVGGVHPKLVELLTLLLEEVERRGYLIKLPGCYGYAGRYTKRSDGSQTTTPSNHSWGTAVDINAPTNAFGGGHDMPPWVAELFRDYGFRWLGPPIEDWMHFDFAGTPADAEAMTNKARKELGENDMGYEEFKRGVRSARDGDKAPGPDAAEDFEFGYALEKRLEKDGQAGPGGVPAHEHTVTGKAK